MDTWLSKGMTVHHLEDPEDPPVEGQPESGNGGGANGGLAVSLVSPCSSVKGGTAPHWQPLTSPCGRQQHSNLGPEAQPAMEHETKGTKDGLTAPKTLLIWQGRRDRQAEQLVNKIITRPMALYG